MTDSLAVVKDPIDAIVDKHQESTDQKLNWLRAGVLGANDGIVSVAAVVVGVAGATTSRNAVLTAGFVALIGGAISMALGEYVSVSSQRDSELAMITRGESDKKKGEIVSAWHAAIASAASFVAGAIWPVLAALLVPNPWKIPAIFAVVLFTLGAAGRIAAWVGNSDAGKSTIRMVVGGALALLVTWGLGALLGQAGIG